MTFSKKLVITMAIAMAIAFLCCTRVFAAGDVAGAIQDTWTTAAAQIKTVVNTVVFPAVDLILAVFVK